MCACDGFFRHIAFMVLVGVYVLNGGCEDEFWVAKHLLSSNLAKLWLSWLFDSDFIGFIITFSAVNEYDCVLWATPKLFARPLFDSVLLEKRKKNRYVLSFLNYVLRLPFFVFIKNVLLPNYQFLPFENGPRVSEHNADTRFAYQNVIYSI